MTARDRGACTACIGGGVQNTINQCYYGALNLVISSGFRFDFDISKFRRIYAGLVSEFIVASTVDSAASQIHGYARLLTAALN